MNKIKIRFQKSSIPLKSLKSSKIYLLIFCFIIAVIIYESLNFTPKAHLIVVDNPEILYESERLTVYFGRDSCISCNEARKYLLSILPNYSNNIYYFNTDTFRKTPEFHQILSDFKVEEVPTMVKISNGAYLDSLLLISDNGTLDKASIQNFLEDLL